MALSSPRPPSRPKAVQPVHLLGARGRPSRAAPGLLNLHALLAPARTGGRRRAEPARPGPRRAAPGPRLPPQQPEANGLSSLTCPRGGACPGD
ncbi:hypothetical protein ACRRTK_020582 [Alexandromys fortis]